MSGNPLNKMGIIIRKPAFWIICVLLLFISIPHYRETLPHPAFLTDALTNIGLTRHAFERILYLIPIFLAGFFYGWSGSFVVSVVALALMLPRTFIISQYTTDAIFETFGVFIIGNILTITFEALHKEKEQRIRLESTHQKLKESEEKFRQLFENAHDAIFIHDQEGSVITTNKAGETLTGYSQNELRSLKMKEILAEESWLITGAIEQMVLGGEDAAKTIEAKLIKKDKTPIFVHLSISLNERSANSVSFQCTARDISEQKRMQENLQYYLQQATRAQEEERKRIALELHDETIQDLVVLSRQLDTLASKGEELSTENNILLKELRQQAKNIIQSLRHISQDLRPATLDRLGLLPALGYLASEVTKLSGIETKVNIQGREQRLAEEVELMLFRITQEALNNIWKHSQAHKAEIILEFDERCVRVSIIDDGRGFYLADTMNNLSKDGKLGLVGMKERARLINGHLRLRSEPNKGTTVVVEVPVETNNQ